LATQSSGLLGQRKIEEYRFVPPNGEATSPRLV
jgi:hypothetical protein